MDVTPSIRWKVLAPYRNGSSSISAWTHDGQSWVQALRYCFNLGMLPLRLRILASIVPIYRLNMDASQWNGGSLSRSPIQDGYFDFWVVRGEVLLRLAGFRPGKCQYEKQFKSIVHFRLEYSRDHSLQPKSAIPLSDCIKLNSGHWNFCRAIFAQQNTCPSISSN